MVFSLNHMAAWRLKLPHFSSQSPFFIGCHSLPDKVAVRSSKNVPIFYYKDVRTFSTVPETNILSNSFDMIIFSGKLLFALAFVTWFHENILDFCPAVGPSMQPLVEGNGDLLVFERWSYKVENFRSKLPDKWKWKKGIDIQRGDVVIAISGGDEAVKVCKRVVAVSGDVILLPSKESSSLECVNENESSEAISTQKCFTIPDGYVWLQGDNVEDSHDSRHYGPVPREYILDLAFLESLLDNTAFYVEWTATSIRWENIGSNQSKLD